MQVLKGLVLLAFSVCACMSAVIVCSPFIARELLKNKNNRK